MESDNQKFLLICLTIAAFLHHLIFFDFTAVHDYAVLKSSIFIVLIVVFYYRALSSQFLSKAKLSQIVLWGAVVLMCLLSVQQYQKQNSNGHSTFKNIGVTIAKYAQPDEVVFMQPGKPQAVLTVPHILYYAERNINIWRGIDQAKGFIKSTKNKKGILFVLDRENKSVEQIGRFSVK